MPNKNWKIYLTMVLLTTFLLTPLSTLIDEEHAVLVGLRKFTDRARSPDGTEKVNQFEKVRWRLVVLFVIRI